MERARLGPMTLGGKGDASFFEPQFGGIIKLLYP